MLISVHVVSICIPYCVCLCSSDIDTSHICSSPKVYPNLVREHVRGEVISLEVSELMLVKISLYYKIDGIKRKVVKVHLTNNYGHVKNIGIVIIKLPYIYKKEKN